MAVGGGGGEKKLWRQSWIETFELSLLRKWGRAQNKMHVQLIMSTLIKSTKSLPSSSSSSSGAAVTTTANRRPDLKNLCHHDKFAINITAYRARQTKRCLPCRVGKIVGLNENDDFLEILKVWNAFPNYYWNRDHWWIELLLMLIGDLVWNFKTEQETALH